MILGEEAVDNHDQTKLEIAAAACEVALEFSCNGTAASDTISKAFVEFAERIRKRVGKVDSCD